MPLGEHLKSKKTGLIHKEHSNSLLGNLAKDYPVLSQFSPRMKLGTLEEKLKVDSLDQALKVLRKKDEEA